MQAENWSSSIRRRLARRILGGLALNPPLPELPAISAEQLAELKELFSLPKFFIFGYPRSGTTLLMRLVQLHPEVHCSREGHFFTRDLDATRLFADAEIRTWLGRRSNRWTAGQKLEPVLVRLVADFIMEREARKLGKRIVGDKTPNSNGGQAVQRAHAIYPDARLIYIVRDGRDAALSHRFQHFIDHPEYLKKEDLRIRQDFARDSRPFFQKQRSVFTPAAIENEALGWSQNVNDSHRRGQELFGDHYASLCYENLLANPLEHLRRLWAFLQVDPDYPGMESQVIEKMAYNPGAEAQQKKEGDLAGKLPRGTQGGWKELFTPRDRDAFKNIAGDELIAWGYEKDKGW